MKQYQNAQWLNRESGVQGMGRIISFLGIAAGVSLPLGFILTILLGDYGISLLIGLMICCSSLVSIPLVKGFRAMVVCAIKKELREEEAHKNQENN